MNDDRITYRQLSRLTDGRDRPAAHAIENAARGLNTAESTIRQTAAMIRAKLRETEQRLDHGLPLNELGELQRMPADLDRAVTLRQHHWQVLAALLTQAELASLKPAAPPAPLPAPAPACLPSPIRRNSIMDRPEIVICGIRRYGDYRTVPEAIGRLCGGYPVTVTVTDPAPPGGDPRGNPRHGNGITVRPAPGGQPELPPETSREARTFETPAVTLDLKDNAPGTAPVNRWLARRAANGEEGPRP